jgi:aldehyde dehydrogenase (NAD+)
MQQVKTAMGAVDLEGVAVAQRAWARTPAAERARLMGRLRRRIASGAEALAETVPTELPGALSRSVADTIAAEVLPLLEACRFLEANTELMLRARQLGRSGRPLWLGGVDGVVERVPWGIVLVLAAGNYPLFLAGAQTLQALAAGNAVLWKPAPGTSAAAFALRTLLVESGMPPELVTLLDTSAEAAMSAIEAGVDHVVLTGSASTGRAVLRQLAETLTPATMELSGCDAVFVLPRADLDRAIEALAFGLRFNGSFTCMAPRRVFLVGMAEVEVQEFAQRLAARLKEIGPVRISAATFALLGDLLEDARMQGAEVVLNGLQGEASHAPKARPTLIARATPSLLSMQSDIFAPLVSLMQTSDEEEAMAASAACSYSLTASIFGPERAARALAGRMRCGNVLINDVVIPTADPRVPFGGRGLSGFGVTRGAEGLLAMTTPRTIQTQHSRSLRPYAPAGSEHAALFAGLAALLHGKGLRARLAGMGKMIGAGRKLK